MDPSIPTAQIQNYTWRALQDFDATLVVWGAAGSSTHRVKKGEWGVITKVNSNNHSLVRARNHTRQGQPEIEFQWQVDVQEKGVPYTNKLKYEIAEAVVAGIRLPKPPTGNRDNVPFKCMAANLIGLWDNKAKVSCMESGRYVDQYAFFLSNHDRVSDTVDAILRNMKAADPQRNRIPGRLFDAKSTFKDIVAGLPDVSGDGSLYGKAGIYMWVYDTFEDPKSAYYGHDPYAYIGSSGSLRRRLDEHILATQKPDSTHYRVASQAKNRKVVLLALQDNPTEGGSFLHGTAMRYLMEQICILAAGTYSRRLFHAESDEDLAAQVGTYGEMAKDAHLHNNIAETAFSISGLRKPQSAGMPNSKTERGLNMNSPVTTNDFEKRTYVLQRLHDRYVFHSRPYTMRIYNSKTKKLKSDPKRRLWETRMKPAKGPHGKNPIFQVLHMTVQGGGGSKDVKYTPNAIKDGDTFWPVWEIMKDKPHDVPYFRLSELGCYDNWEIPNRIGFKVVSVDSKTNECYTQYKQSSESQAAQRRFSEPWTDGCISTYAEGISLYEHFMRGQYPNRLPFIPDAGFANVVEFRVDHFRQTIAIRNINTPLAQFTGPVGPRYDYAKARMEQLGLQNVAPTPGSGQWGKRDMAWFDQVRNQYYDERVWKIGKTKFSRLTICDTCWTIAKRDYKVQNECVDYKGSGICNECRASGHPCSFSAFNVLGWAPAMNNFLPPDLAGPIRRALFFADVNFDKLKKHKTPNAIMSKIALSGLGEDDDEADDDDGGDED